MGADIKPPPSPGADPRPCRRFLRGLPVAPVALPEELAAAVVAEPVPGAVRYVLHTQVGAGRGERGGGPGPRPHYGDPPPVPSLSPDVPPLSPQPGPGPQLLRDPERHLLGADGLPRRTA